MNKFPDDEDGAVLRQLSERGFDFSKEVEVEFSIYSPNESAMITIEKAVSYAGFNAEGYFDEGELEEGQELTDDNEEFGPSWTVYVSKVMKLKYDDLISIQNKLNTLALPFQGKCDGWVVEC